MCHDDVVGGVGVDFVARPGRKKTRRKKRVGLRLELSNAVSFPKKNTVFQHLQNVAFSSPIISIAAYC
jgi:hypothetical protein